MWKCENVKILSSRHSDGMPRQVVKMMKQICKYLFISFNPLHLCNLCAIFLNFNFDICLVSNDEMNSDILLTASSTVVLFSARNLLHKKIFLCNKKELFLAKNL